MGLYKSVSHVDLPSISQALVSLTEDSSPLTALSDYPPPPLIVKFNLPELALFPLPIFPDCSSKQHAWDAKKLKPNLPVLKIWFSSRIWRRRKMMTEVVMMVQLSAKWLILSSPAAADDTMTQQTNLKITSRTNLILTEVLFANLPEISYFFSKMKSEY